MLKSEKYPYQLSRTNAARLNNDDDEVNLGKLGAALRRRALLIAGITGVVATAAVLKAEADPPVYEGQFEILTESVTGEGKAVANLPQALGGEGNVSVPESVETNIKVLTSPRVLDPVIQKLQTKYPELDYKSITERLTIVSQQPEILTVAYTDPNKQVVTDVLDEVADAYLEYSLTEQQADINQAIKFVRERINQGGLKQQVLDWQNKLRTLRRANNLIESVTKSESGIFSNWYFSSRANKQSS